MQANKHKTYLCAHIQWQDPEVHTRPEGVAGFGLRGGGLGASGAAHHTNKSSHKPLTYIQQTVNIFTIEQVYRYTTLLLGLRVFLGGVRTDT